MTKRSRFTVEFLKWTDEPLGSVRLPSLPLTFRPSFGSGLSRRGSDPPGWFWACGDRGPNLKIRTLLERYGAQHLAPLKSLPGAKVMPRLDIGPRIAQFTIDGDTVRLIASVPVSDSAGQPVSGLPMPTSPHTVTEPVFTLDGEPLDPDPSGLDSEGIAALEDGTFLLSEEFGPSLVRLDSQARVLARYVPEGCDLAGARYPLHQTLPAIAGKRQLNRGFEGIAASCDQKWLYLAFQSPLAHPDEAAHKRARHVRLWHLDAATMRVVGQYLYPLDLPGTFLRDGALGPVDWCDLKISEMVCLASGGVLVLERASHTTKICRILPSDDLALAPEHLAVETRPTLEELSAQSAPLQELGKQLLFTTDDAPEIGVDLEGMIVLSPFELLLVNDNDFGVEGAETRFCKVTFAEPILA